MSETVYDEALQRLHRTGPEFEGWLSNHGPMVVEAMARHGHAGEIHRWLDRYLDRLDELPRRDTPINDTNWREARRATPPRRLVGVLHARTRRTTMDRGAARMVVAPSPWYRGRRHSRGDPGGTRGSRDETSVDDSAAVLRVLPVLPRDLWQPSLAAAWAASAAVASAYAPRRAPERVPPYPAAAPEEVFARAVAHGDEHVVKLADAALEVHARGHDPAAVAPALHAVAIVPT